MSEAVQSDWRQGMVAQAGRAGAMLAAKEGSRNPLIPDNFLDVSNAGFPADLTIVAVQIPRQASPAEMAQYRNLVNYGWLHVPWDAISANGGNDGKANVPGAQKVDLGGGNFVATLAGHYLMFADKKQYEERRARNVARASQNLQYKTEELEETSEHGRMYSRSDSSGPMSLEELVDYEEKLGDEPEVKGEVRK